MGFDCTFATCGLTAMNNEIVSHQSLARIDFGYGYHTYKRIRDEEGPKRNISLKKGQKGSEKSISFNFV